MNSANVTSDPHETPPLAGDADSSPALTVKLVLVMFLLGIALFGALSLIDLFTGLLR
jgi:hypothetical protein